MSLQLASRYYSYSNLFEIVSNKILEQFPKDYFKNIVVLESHPLEEYKKFNYKDILKKEKPILLISPKYDSEYDRDPFIFNPFGLNIVHLPNGSGIELLADYKKNIFLSIDKFVEMKCDFPLRIKVGSRSKQIELLNYINNSLCSGYSMVLEKDVKYPLPKDIVIQLAKDLKLNLLKDEYDKLYIKNNVDLLNYFNSHSLFKFDCEYNTHIGRYTYYVVFKKIRIVLDMSDRTSLDDGEKRGQYYTDFNIDFSIKSVINVPNAFLYHSEFQHFIPKFEEFSEKHINSILNYTFVIDNITVPKFNDKGWNIIKTNRYYEENLESKIQNINILEILGNNEDIKLMFEHKQAFPPSMYIDIKFYNKGFVDIDIDWDNMMLNVCDKVEDKISNIFVYLDILYLKKSINLIKKESS